MGNPDEIVRLVKSNSNNLRVCAVGIGNGISSYLLSNIAKQGHCAAEFVRDDEDLGEKALRLVQMSISHVLTDFSFTIESSKLNPVQYTFPQANKLPIIPKNTPFKMWVKFSNSAINSKDPVVFHIACRNSFTDQVLKYQIPLDLSQAIEDEFFHKLETSEKIASLIVDNSDQRYSNQIYKKEIVELSLKYQVLSEETAFFALIKEDAVSQPWKTKTINIPNHESCDYQANPTPVRESFSSRPSTAQTTSSIPYRERSHDYQAYSAVNKRSWFSGSSSAGLLKFR